MVFCNSYDVALSSRCSRNRGISNIFPTIFLDRWNVIFCLVLQDLNIGIALWLAAGGDGWVCEGHRSSNNEDVLSVRYRSKARILLVGSGADEQCAGYGRHRTKYRNGRWDVL